VLGITVALITSWLFAANNVIQRIVKEIDFSVVLFYHTLIGSTTAFIASAIYSYMMGTPFL
jgi:hypothetical protein